MKRRILLQTLASGLLLPLSPTIWAATGTPNQKKLIVIMLRGAVDGLSVVAPYADADYRLSRPNIALGAPGTENGVIDLDGYFGLHPALNELLPLWQAKQLAFVHASGSPDSTRSHFDAQDYMETATPGKKSTQDGWLNRLLQNLGGETPPTRALAIGALMPRMLAGSARATNIASGAAGTRANALDRPAIGSAFAELYQSNPKYAQAYQDAKKARSEIMQAAMDAPDGGAPLPNGFPDDAARVARLMHNDPRIQFVSLSLGGWDTHANQGQAQGQLANRLRPLGQGLAILCKQLGSLLSDTQILVMSEFGRTVRENGNAGTDHGHGNVMWLLGGGVQGGRVHGEWPGLTQTNLYEGRDLAITTDFRTVLAQVCTQHLGLPDKQLTRILPDFATSNARLNLYV